MKEAMRDTQLTTRPALIRQPNPRLEDAMRYRSALSTWYAKMAQAGHDRQPFTEPRPQVADFDHSSTPNASY